MAYIGKTPVIGNFQKCDSISVVNGQAAYTLQVGGVNVSPQSENHMLVSLNGILQAPVDSFTVSGSTLTFASNLVTGDVIDFVMILGNVLDLGTPSDNTVSLAKLTATGTKDATTFLRGDNTFGVPPLGGITVADQWRLTADKAINNTLSVIDANLEQVDTPGQGTLGTAMSESSGIFTFPSTGIYLVISNVTFQNSNSSNSNYVFIEHQITTNNSSYTNSVESYQYFNVPTGTIYATATGIDMVDVTDTSNVKVRFRARSQSDCAIRSATNTSFTTFTFIRLGDT